MEIPDNLVRKLIEELEELNPSSELLAQLRGATTESIRPDDPPPKDPL